MLNNYLIVPTQKSAAFVDMPESGDREKNLITGMRSQAQRMYSYSGKEILFMTRKWQNVQT